MTDLSFCAQRRARFAALLGPNAVAVIPTAPERARNRDSDFPYRHDSYFFYLTGFAEPSWRILLACVLITGGAVLAAKEMIRPRKAATAPAE